MTELFQKIKKLLKGELFSNVLWALIGRFSTLFGQLIAGIVAARIIGPTSFGTLSYIISFITIFSVLASFGLDQIEIRELTSCNNAFNRKRENELSTLLLLRLILGSCSYLLLILTLFLFQITEFRSLLLLYGLILFFQSCNPLRNYFTAVLENKYVVISELFRNIFGTALKISLVFLHAPLWLLIAAYAFDYLLLAAGYWQVYHKRISGLSFHFDTGRAWHYLKEAFPLLLSSAVIIVYQKIDQVIIHSLMNDAAVGNFAIACKIVEVASIFPIIMSQTVVPALVKSKETSREQYLRASQKMMDLTVWSSVLVAMLVCAMAKPAIYICFGSQYLSATPALQIMAWKVPAMALSAFSGYLIIIDQLQKYAILRNIAGCVICLALNCLLIPHYGINGSATASLMTMFFSGLLAHFFIRPYWEILRIQLRSIFFGWYHIVNEKLFIKG